MKKIILITIALSLVLLNGCNKNEVLDAMDSKSCFEICHNHIPEICPEYYLDLDGLTFENCESDCEKFWNDTAISCISDATKCEQLSYDEPYCYEDPEPAFEEEEEPKENAKCDKACKNYGKCAGYADDATEADIAEAYTTCYSECQGWAEETIKCTSKKINNVMDCATLSMCGLKEYTNKMNLQ